MIGTAGGSGAAMHRRWCLDIVQDVLLDLNRSAYVAHIAADQSAEEVTRALAESRIRQLGPV